MERRITPQSQEKEGGQLKQIAGLIQKLSYRDMQKLADIVNGKWVAEDGDGTEAMAISLLQASDDILAGNIPS